MQISISDYEEAELWKGRVEAEITETKALLDRVARAIQEVKSDADGTIVDEIYHYGSEFLNFAVEVEKGMTSVLKSVGSFLKGFNDMINKGKNLISSAINSITDF